jgi:hypothetical protein
MRVIDEREMKKGQNKKLHVGGTTSGSLDTFDPMLAHEIQLLQCRLSTLFPIYLVKHVEILLHFLHVRVHVKHGIVLLVIHDIIYTRSTNTFTLPLKNRQLAQWNFFYYVVSRHMRIHIIGA